MKRLAVLGRGVSFPLSPGSTGTLDYAEGPEKVRQSIRIILETEPAERIMRPSFGVGLRRFLMKPNTAATRARIKQEVERGLAEAEPRIQLDEVRVAPGDDPSLVLIQVFYRLLRDGRPGNLVYPFYLE